MRHVYPKRWNSLSTANLCLLPTVITAPRAPRPWQSGLDHSLQPVSDHHFVNGGIDLPHRRAEIGTENAF